MYSYRPALLKTINLYLMEIQLSITKEKLKVGTPFIINGKVFAYSESFIYMFESIECRKNVGKFTLSTGLLRTELFGVIKLKYVELDPTVIEREF